MKEMGGSGAGEIEQQKENEVEKGYKKKGKSQRTAKGAKGEKRYE